MYNARKFQIAKICKSALVISILMGTSASQARDNPALQVQKEEQIFTTECVAVDGILTAIKNILRKPTDTKSTSHECRKISFKDRVYKKIIEPTYAGLQQTDRDFRTLAQKVESKFTSKEILFTDAVKQASRYTSVSISTPSEQLDTLENYRTTNK